RLILDGEHRQVVARTPACREALDGLYHPVREGTESVTRGVRHDLAEALQAERVARRVERFGHPVRTQDQGIAGGEVTGPAREDPIHLQAESGPALQGERAGPAIQPAHQRPLVAGARIPELAAVRVELTASRRDERAGVVALGEPVVELAQDPIGPRS